LLQQEVLSGVVCGARWPEGWSDKAIEVDFFDVKGDLQTLFALGGGGTAFEFVVAEHVALHPGQTAAIHYRGHAIGWLGALHPGLAKELGLQGAVFLFELILADLQTGILPRYLPLSRFPEVRRDLALVVDWQINVADIAAELRQSAGEWLTRLRLFDVYMGQGIENSQKSLALGLTWQHPSRTLTDEEVNQWVAQSVTALTDRYGASLRS
jgi:phenylalanyl-tRNA synthetase beta chain